MTTIRWLAAPAMLAAGALSAASAQAQELKIGIIAVLSGPQAVLGGQVRDGFNLGVKHAGGKLGGLATSIIVQDDELKPDVAVGKAKQLVERDKVELRGRPVFSNILMAIAKPITGSRRVPDQPERRAPRRSPARAAARSSSPPPTRTISRRGARQVRAGQGLQEGLPAGAQLSGRQGHDRRLQEALQRRDRRRGLHAAGPARFLAELAKIAAAKPDAFFVFMPGGMGVNLVKQYRQAGLDTIPFLSVFTVDESTLPAQQDAAVGFFSGMTWAPNSDTPQNKKFVADFEKEYGYVPGSYAMQAYDAAAAHRQRGEGGGRQARQQGRAAGRHQEGRLQVGARAFKFNSNGFPVQDFYLVKVAKRADGKFETEIVQKVFENATDSYAKDCELK
jgi:branched-chain amino acid transport system substrate-binding protein